MKRQINTLNKFKQVYNAAISDPKVREYVEPWTHDGAHYVYNSPCGYYTRTDPSVYESRPVSPFLWREAAEFAAREMGVCLGRSLRRSLPERWSAA